MPGLKLSAKAQETVEYLETLLKECDHFASLVEQYASARTNPDQLSGQLARELGQLRQKAMIKNLGFVADTAGQLGVQAGRSGSQPMKSRVLRDGVASLKALVERTVRATIQADESEQKEKAYLKAKEAKLAAERVKARVLAEEARQAAKTPGAPAPPPPRRPPPPPGAKPAAQAPRAPAAAPASPPKAPAAPAAGTVKPAGPPPPKP